MIFKVATLLLDRVSMFEFGVVCEVFGIDRTEHGVPPFDFRICGIRPGEPLASITPGLTLSADFGLDFLRDADLVVVPPPGAQSDFPVEALDAVRAAANAGAIVLSLCSGVFLLGEAGLLAGRKCTTHWEYVDELATRFPTATVDPDVLFVDEGNLVTSAGTAAGIDACLHVVRRELGSTVANTIARRMVVPPQRDGGQRQFIEQPVVACTSDSLSETMAWMSENLELPHTVDELAARSSMSTRTFARKFAAETGTTPVKWLTTQRVLYARQLLEGTDLGLEAISRRSGFGSGALLRHHFNRVVGVAPADYRRRFGCNAAELRQ
ncbi:helix-turn-helix domain-containing protein [Rhodococcus opacus]|uniref:helix-turn-helix domain-containing protein n=1 Tax=Rhodococcus opacus TaxID=37919 RepID=UPI0002A2C887|nr:helix-turn-helix domain-containing protein [Rhodococcus opacus]ELB94670.1 AraC family transcriptional regulator [Rhodococcus wratislaviensis IFP 2016]MDX5968214.1 helix-turn-helix domain-containing protein [Rhodococcus opacus]NKY73223.1 helix-turn-helix domain-containing protein [Rhodococcus opacus]CAG7588338.1 HTH-type transcriptional regulator CdhR [Rhodococcus opacus]